MSSLAAPVRISAALLALGVAGLLAALLGDPLQISTGSLTLLSAQFTVGLSLTAVSSVLLTFIAGLSLITAEYSRRNLRGQARLARYGWLHVTATLALALLVTAASLPLLAVGWTASGLAVAALVAHRGTAAAERAARTVRRRLLVGDALLWSGVLLAAAALPSLDRAGLAAAVASASPGAVTAVALLLVLAAVPRSALLPGQRWLFETAEAPSPVSALLHAGVVNGVGLLAVLAWPVIAAAPAARGVLIVAGVATAAALTLAMRHRADVKGRLAASTSAQMGYLAVQIGLGLPLAGLLHLIGHGCYKAHLFLRAGGEVSRSRNSLGAASGRGAGAGRSAAALAVLGVAVLGVAVLVGLATWPSVPLADALPIGVAAAAAAVAVLAVAAPGPGLSVVATRRARLAAFALVPAALAGYLVLLGAWTRGLPGFDGAAQVWSGPAIAGWLALLLAAFAVVRVAAARLDAGGLPALRAWLGAASLRPGDRVRGAAPLPADAALQAGRPLDAAIAGIAVDAAAVVVGPAWPLRTAVAANPLAGLHDLSIEDADVVVRRTWGARTRPERGHHVRAYRIGRITDADLAGAVERARALPAGHASGLVRSVLLAVSEGPVPQDALLRAAIARRLRALPGSALAALEAGLGEVRPVRTCTEQADAGAGTVLTEIADQHAAAWFADLLAAPDRAAVGAGELWRGWRARVAAPGMDRLLGVPGFGAAVAVLPDDPAAALGRLLPAARPDPADHVAYLGRLLARQPGWPGHLAYRAFAGGPDLRADLLAVRASYDVLLVRAAAPHVLEARPPRPDGAAVPVAVLDAAAAAARALGLDDHGVDAADLGEVHSIAQLAAVLAGPVGDALWQDAFERRYRNRVVDRIAARAAAGPAPATAPEVHLVACIDVRSERLRRHLEADPAIDTYGFAGFFGIFLRHEPDAGRVSDQCPVLLPATSRVPEHIGALPHRQGTARLLGAATTAAGSAPLTPFALAEAAAPVAGALAAAQTLAPRTWRRGRDWLRGAPERGLRGQLEVATALPLQVRADAVHGFLTAIGLTRPTAPLLVVVGHGAALENNAFAAAYDCGACGGNSGGVNARALALMINDPDVRAAVAERGIVVPDGTVAVPALHLTTTDDLVIDEADVPAQAADQVARLRGSIRHAQLAAAAERVATLPAGDLRDPLGDVRRRSGDWAEATPEWGLAGNALLVVGPRWMTRGLNLHGRSFLHSYDPATDPQRRVLEVILTAPMVVAHWISSQYYASTVDPEVFGAGDKTTHNVVADLAVLSGAHGDLRVGLPWQGLFDADPLTGRPGVAHEPMRLQVLVHAPRADVLAILQRHPDVARLVTNGWLSLAVLEPADAQAHLLTRELAWQRWDTDPVAAVLISDAEIAGAAPSARPLEAAGEQV
jgi:uncharacterized protein YbcC (UPF0753/DUF2309 family)/formate hydrogenlyase subunit 3/multisubunit Na+/H+ antiporter MnhD subunit